MLSLSPITFVVLLSRLQLTETIHVYYVPCLGGTGRVNVCQVHVFTFNSVLRQCADRRDTTLLGILLPYLFGYNTGFSLYQMTTNN